MKDNAEEIIKAITEVYQKDTFTMGELADILTDSGYTQKQIRRIIHQANSKNLIGKVVYNLGRHIPQYNCYLLLRPKPKRKTII